jgi:hypothetical protein
LFAISVISCRILTVYGFIFPPCRENGILSIDMKGENPMAHIDKSCHMASSIVLFKLFAQITIFFI